MTKIEEIKKAKLRRAKLLAEYLRRGGKGKLGLITKMAGLRGISPSRMGYLLGVAKREASLAGSVR